MTPLRGADLGSIFVRVGGGVGVYGAGVSAIVRRFSSIFCGESVSCYSCAVESVFIAYLRVDRQLDKRFGAMDVVSGVRYSCAFSKRSFPCFISVLGVVVGGTMRRSKFRGDSSVGIRVAVRSGGDVYRGCVSVIRTRVPKGGFGSCIIVGMGGGLSGDVSRGGLLGGVRRVFFGTGGPRVLEGCARLRNKSKLCGVCGALRCGVVTPCSVLCGVRGDRFRLVVLVRVGSLVVLWKTC